MPSSSSRSRVCVRDMVQVDQGAPPGVGPVASSSTDERVMACTAIDVDPPCWARRGSYELLASGCAGLIYLPPHPARIKRPLFNTSYLFNTEYPNFQVPGRPSGSNLEEIACTLRWQGSMDSQQSEFHRVVRTSCVVVFLF